MELLSLNYQILIAQAVNPNAWKVCSFTAVTTMIMLVVKAQKSHDHLTFCMFLHAGGLA